MNHDRLDESFLAPRSNTSELFLKNTGLQRGGWIRVMIVQTKLAPRHALGMLRCAMHVIPRNWICSMERMDARSAPDIRVFTGKRGAADGIARRSGDRHETADASSARLREYAFEALMNSVIKKMAVGIDHGEGWGEQRHCAKVSNNNINSLHLDRPFQEQSSAFEASPCITSKGITAWPYLS